MTTRKAANSRAGKPWVELAKIDGQWHWCLWSANGRALATSAQGYPDQNTAKQAFRNTSEAHADPSIQMRASTEPLTPSKPSKETPTATPKELPPCDPDDDEEIPCETCECEPEDEVDNAGNPITPVPQQMPSGRPPAGRNKPRHLPT